MLSGRLALLVLMAMGGWSGCGEEAKVEVPPAPYAEAPLPYFDGLGGEFVLSDQEGRAFGLGQSKGQVQLLFFGYTFCPDACPLTLARLTQAYQLLGAEADSLLTVFVSLDPQRDTPPVLAEYLKHFPIGVVGLTASTQVLDQVVAAFGAHYRLAPSGSRAGYSVDHSTNIYLIDGSGRVRFLFDQEDSPAKIAAVVRQLFKEGARPLSPLVQAAYALGRPAPLGCGVLRRFEQAPPVWFFGEEADSAKAAGALQPEYPLGLEAFNGLPPPR